MRDREDYFTVSMMPDCPETAKWYCLVVQPSKSISIGMELYALGHRSFSPRARRWTKHSRKLSAVERPIAAMGSYVFFEVDYPKQGFSNALAIRGVIEVLSASGRPVPFSRDDVADFMRRQIMGEWDEISKETKLPVGARVTVVTGPHDGKKAIVTKTQGKKIFAKVEGYSQICMFFGPDLRTA